MPILVHGHVSHLDSGTPFPEHAIDSGAVREEVVGELEHEDAPDAERPPPPRELRAVPRQLEGGAGITGGG